MADRTIQLCLFALVDLVYPLSKIVRAGPGRIGDMAGQTRLIRIAALMRFRQDRLEILVTHAAGVIFHGRTGRPRRNSRQDCPRQNQNCAKSQDRLITSFSHHIPSLDYPETTNPQKAL